MKLPPALESKSICYFELNLILDIPQHNFDMQSEKLIFDPKKEDTRRYKYIYMSSSQKF
jgi:hypothetical protein